ncbi:hypothetical protein HAX54_052420 [Datura stramonium]|uniref:Uncharacterized protein n=1 Tax=Datura stramonium TaxID=4076 RepID=A0ABS8RSB5_DATST|nr:hypothetical protein [Datura stramonium]
MASVRDHRPARFLFLLRRYPFVNSSTLPSPKSPYHQKQFNVRRKRQEELAPDQVDPKQGVSVYKPKSYEVLVADAPPIRSFMPLKMARRYSKLTSPESATRFTLGETKEELFRVLLLQEEKGSSLEFLRRGYKTATWWEEDVDLEASSASRS